MWHWGGVVVGFSGWGGRREQGFGCTNYGMRGVQANCYMCAMQHHMRSTWCSHSHAGSASTACTLDKAVQALHVAISTNTALRLSTAGSIPPLNS